MDGEEYHDFLSALGDEFCEALRPVDGQHRLVPQDGYEVYVRAFAAEPSPRALASLTDAELEHLRAQCEEYLECEGVTVDHVRTFVSGVLARWPADDP